MNLSKEDAKGTACIGCRLRRKKCNKKQPICSGCSDLQIPRELCIYRKMGLAAKDSKATLAKEIKKNRELRDDKERTAAVFKYNKKSTGSAKDYFYLRDTRRDGPHKMLQLNPEKNPLLCTVMTGPQTSAYLGSISVAAITEAEPQMKLLLQNIHRVIMREKALYEMKVAEAAQNPETESVVSTFNEHCKASLVGMKDIDGDQSILELIANIEQNFPSEKTCEHVLSLFFRQNTHRWTLFPYVDEVTFRNMFKETVRYDAQGRASFQIQLTYQTDRIIFIAWLLAILALASFCFGQSKTDLPEMNYVLYAKYAHALTRIDMLGKKFRLGESSVSPDFICVVYTLLLLEKYTASAGFMSSLHQICEPTLNIRLLITMAMSVNLHRDLERFYPYTTESQKRSMKSLWYTLVLYESFESMDVGFISKFEPPTFRRNDYCYNPIIETIHVIHSVLFNYNMVDDMGKVDDLTDFIESYLIKRLKGVLKSEFRPMHQDMEIFQNYKFDDLSLENLEEYSMILQRIALRFFILGTILAFYHVGFKRMQQTGGINSEKCKKFRLLGWKYALAIETLLREMWIGCNRMFTHKNYIEFYPVASILLMTPILRFSQRRVTLYAISRLMSIVNVDEQMVVDNVLYGDNSYNATLLTQLELSGELDNLYKLSDFDDLDVDDDYEQLVLKFGRLDNVRFLLISLCKMMSDTLRLMHTEESTFNFLKLSKIFHILLLRLCLFLLYYTSQQKPDTTGNELHLSPSPLEKNVIVSETTPPDQPKFDFKAFFSVGQDVIMDEDDLLQLFNMTAQNRSTW